jgi:hypothetical protein
MIDSRWNEIHTRGDVPFHAWRIHWATEPVTEDVPIPGEPRELDQLRWARWIAAEAQQLVEAAVIEARAARCTWGEIGDVDGLSRQAAHKRYSHLEPS